MAHCSLALLWGLHRLSCHKDCRCSDKWEGSLWAHFPSNPATRVCLGEREQAFAPLLTGCFLSHHAQAPDSNSEPLPLGRQCFRRGRSAEGFPYAIHCSIPIANHNMRNQLQLESGSRGFQSFLEKRHLKDSWK